MVRTQRYAPFNVVVVVRLDGPLRAPDLRRALGLAASRHPLLRCRVEGTSRFVVDPSGAPPIHTVERRDDETWREVVERELSRELDLAAGPLVVVTLVEGAGARRELVWTFAHVVVDAVSGGALVAEVLAAATGELRPGGSEVVAEPVPDPERAFPPAHRGPGGRLRAGIAFARQGREELSFLLRARPSPVRLGTGNHRVGSLEWSAEETRALLRACRQRRLTLNSVLNAAACRIVRDHVFPDLRRGRLRTFTMAGLRSLLDPPVGPEPLGGLFSMLRYTLDVGRGDGLWELATRLQTSIRRGVARGDRFTAWHTSEALMRTLLTLRKARMGEVAVSYTGPETSIRPAYGELRVLGLQVHVSTIDLGPPFVVQARVWDGRLALGIAGWKNELSEETMEAAVEGLAGLLTRATGEAA